MSKPNANFLKCKEYAKAVVDAYKKRTLLASTADLPQLQTWTHHNLNKYQTREKAVNPEFVATIIRTISHDMHIRNADPILVAEQNGVRLLINGNNTAAALEQVIRLQIVPGVFEAPIAVIPHDMLPSDPADRAETIKQIAMMMNIQVKHAQGVFKNDMRRAIAEDAKKGVDIHNEQYQEIRASSAHMPIATIKDLVSKVASLTDAERTNSDYNFIQLNPAALDKAKRKRKTAHNFVQIATVSKNIAGSLAGVIDHQATHKGTKGIHILFHFKNYDDINNFKVPAEEYMENVKELLNFPVTYEFLDDQQFVATSNNVTNFIAAE